MILAIVGSTALGGLKSRQIIREVIKKYNPSFVVSGGAEGIDTAAIEEAKKLGIQTIELKPEIHRWDDKNGKKGFRTRNLEIAYHCQVLVRIAWCANDQKSLGLKPSYGSGWTRDRAKELGVVIEEYSLTLKEDQHDGRETCA